MPLGGVAGSGTVWAMVVVVCSADDRMVLAWATPAETFAGRHLIDVVECWVGDDRVVGAVVMPGALHHALAVWSAFAGVAV